MWDNVVMFPFHEIYLISFVNKFNFVNYINKWNNNLHMVHVHKKCSKCKYHLGWTNKKGLWPTNWIGSWVPTLMYLSLPTYLLKFLDYLAFCKWIGSSLIMVFKSIIHFMVMVSLKHSTNPLKCLMHSAWTHEIGQNTFEINPFYKLKL
jgi:hypothetical protein